MKKKNELVFYYALPKMGKIDRREGATHFKGGGRESE